MDHTFLYELLSTGSVSGNEIEIEKKIFCRMKDLADEVYVDEMGNVTSAINVSSPFKVMLCAHADEIGLMISKIESNGFLKVTSSGGVKTSCFPGQKIRIYTNDKILYGACVYTKELSEKSSIDPGKLYIDIGAESKEDAEKHVSVGDPVTIDTDSRELLGSRICARALDDKSGVFVITEALRIAKERGASVGAYAVTTTGEETTMNGAYFSASRIKPDIAIAVDVTYTTDYPGASDAEGAAVELGKGPVLCISPSVNKKVNELLTVAAKKAGIKIQTEVAGNRTYTDADVVHKTGIGVPFALVSIPLRYMHSPSETADLDDIDNAVRLLVEFVLSLNESTDLKPF